MPSMTNTHRTPRRLIGRIALTAGLALGATIGGLVIARPVWAWGDGSICYEGVTHTFDTEAAYYAFLNSHPGATEGKCTPVVTTAPASTAPATTTPAAPVTTAPATTTPAAAPPDDAPPDSGPPAATDDTTPAPADVPPVVDDAAPAMSIPDEVAVAAPPAPPEECLDLGDGQFRYRYTQGDCAQPCTVTYTPTGELAGVCVPPAVVPVHYCPAGPNVPTQADDANCPTAIALPGGPTMPATGSRIDTMLAIATVLLVLGAALGVTKSRRWGIRRRTS